MQSKLILLITLSLFCLQTYGLYNLSDKRYQELLSKINHVQFSDQKTSLLTLAASTLGFNCTQVRGLIDSFSTEGDKLVALNIFKNNIVDPTNKQKQIIDMFNLTEDKQRATEILTNIVACKVVPHPNDPYPALDIPYTNKWDLEDLTDLIKVITKVPPTYSKIRIAEIAVNSRTEVLSPEQAMLLFGVFTNYRDILILRELIKERMVGLSTQQLYSLLERFSYDGQRSTILDTLQCANDNATCNFNNDLLSLADFIHIGLKRSTCEKLSPVAEKFAFEDQKLEILEGFSSAVIDTDNKYSLLGAFSFNTTKEKAKKIIDNFKPNSYIFGSPSGKIVFILDVSGSMSTTFKVNGTQTTRLDFMRKEFAKVVNSFNESTAFAVLAFADRVVPWNNNLVNATQSNIKSGVEFGYKYPANGGTNSHEALRVAFNMAGVETIYFLSDGSPSVGTKTDPNAIIADVKTWNSKANIKVNSIALIMGTMKDENKVLAKNFMKTLSETTGGAYRILESDN
jgi:Mg-chelatase subunit ChlD